MQGALTSACKRAHWWIITTHPAGSPLNMDGGKQPQKTSSLLGQAYHLTWCTNIYPRKPNHTWEPSETSKRPQINTGKGNPIISRPRTITIPTIHAVRRHQSCLPQEIGSNRKKYTDQTGRLPVTSSKGSKYILVAYHYDSNTIHAELLKTRSGLDLTTAYKKSTSF